MKASRTTLMPWLLVLLAVPALAQAQSYNWADRTPPPGFRNDSAMAYDSARGVTVLFGGVFWDGVSHYYGDTWEWNGATGIWTQRSTTGPSPRAYHATAYDSARGVTVLFGGYNGSNSLGDTWEWNGVTGIWTQRSSTGPSPRIDHAMAYDSARGVTVLFGGDNNGSFYGDTWEWDGTSGTWTQRSNTGPSPRYAHAMAYDSARGATVLFGGRDSIGVIEGDTWEWDGASGTWTQRSGTGPSWRYLHTMAYDSVRGATVLFGGLDRSHIKQGDTWEWNGTTGTWTQRSSTGPSPRIYHAMAYDSARGATVLFGGRDSSTDNQGDTWEWNGATGTWTRRSSPGPSTRLYHAMAYDSARGATVLFGGYNDNRDYHKGDTWEWDGTSQIWTQRSSTGPSPRALHAMAYDSARGVTVLFGGAYWDSASRYCNDTWEWDGAAETWTQRSTSGPSPRADHAMAYDSIRGVTVLFGGYFYDTTYHYNGDTWEWNGTTGTWTQRSSTGPSPRSSTMAYDSARGVAVLFGGYNNGSYYGDTWEWNGTTETWTQRSSIGPSPRAGHAMAYDSARGVTVLFGGSSQSDTWEWNGTTGTWTQRSSTGPSPRQGHATAYDIVRGVTVLFGGCALNAIPLGDTWEYQVACASPTVVSAVSRKTHGTSGTYDTNSGNIEGRVNGPTTIVATFDQSVHRVTGTDADFTLSSGTLGTATVAGAVVTIDLSGVTDQAIFTIGFPGIASDSDNTTATATKCWKVLQGDVNGFSPVNNFDVLAIRSLLGQVTDGSSFTKDVNPNGKIDNFDMLFTRGKLGNALSGTCGP